MKLTNNYFRKWSSKAYFKISLYSISSACDFTFLYSKSFFLFCCNCLLVNSDYLCGNRQLLKGLATYPKLLL